MDNADDIAQQLDTAITGAVAPYMVTGWLALVEVVDPNGERAVISAAHPEAKAWHTLGLLTFGLQLEQAATVHDDGEA